MMAIVVDDSALMRLVERKALQSLGWTVEVATNGEEALGVLEEHPECDLLLTDWHMPGLDGMGLVAKIRATEQHRRMRIVLVTSDVVHDTVTKAIAAGANDLIMKPFTPESFSERIHGVMRGR